MGRSGGGLTSKIHALVDSNGLPVRLALSPGEAHDVRLAGKLLSRLKSGSMLLADRGYVLRSGLGSNRLTNFVSIVSPYRTNNRRDQSKKYKKYHIWDDRYHNTRRANLVFTSA